MLTQLIWQDLTSYEKRKALERPAKKNAASLIPKVQEIINLVRYEGDPLIRELTRKFDKVNLTDLQVAPSEINAAFKAVKTTTVRAIERAISNIETFHKLQYPQTTRIETEPGILCEYQFRPIQNVGLYVPAGTAPLVSTVLMLGVPARIARCPSRILCSPPQNQGEINPNILVAAKLCGIETIYKVGGTQAIAAMAYGTETIGKVDKIFGPGNSWVTEAKMLVAQDPSGAVCDLPAGPSEVLVIADETADPTAVAADLLAQAEHGIDSQVMLLTTSKALSGDVIQALQQQLPLLSRQTIALESLKNSCLILVNSVQDAIEIANRYAPEHLIIQVRNPRNYLNSIQCAGSIFLGPWTPESVGDYASGTNHVLPTNGYARSLSGLSVRDFMRTLSVQELTQNGLAGIAETIRELTTIEGLDAHQNAIDIRLKGVKQNA